MDDPRFFEFPGPASGAVQSIDGGLDRSLVGFHEPRRKVVEMDQALGRTEAFEPIDQFITILAAAHHHG